MLLIHKARFRYEASRGANLHIRFYPSRSAGEIREQFGQHDELMTVDSGARNTLLPIRLALDIGYQASELIPDGKGIGVEGEFDKFRLADPIWAKVLHYSDGRRTWWGPQLELTPSFAERERYLLGRTDFFRFFDVLFTRIDGQRVFELSYATTEPD